MMQLLAIPAFFFVVTMVVLIFEMRGYFSEHFDEYKCKPWFMPFVSWIRSDVSVTENSAQCLGNVSRVVQGAIMSPMMDIATDLVGGQNIQADNLAKIQHQLTRKNASNAQLLLAMNNQTGAFQAVGRVMMIKLGAIFNNMMALVYDMYYGLISITSMYEQAIFTPQIVLYVIALIGAGLTAFGVDMTDTGAGLVTAGNIIAADGEVMMLDIFTEPIGVAMVGVGEGLVEDGWMDIGTGVVSGLIPGAIYLGVGATFSALLAYATACNNTLAAQERLQRSVID